MASSPVPERLQKISDLKCYLESVEDKVKEITTALNWNYDELCQEKDRSSLVTCSVNIDHRVQFTHIHEHEEKCRWLKEGYREEDLPFPEYPGCGSYVVFTPELQNTVLTNVCSSGNDFHVSAKVLEGCLS